METRSGLAPRVSQGGRSRVPYFATGCSRHPVQLPVPGRLPQSDTGAWACAQGGGEVSRCVAVPQGLAVSPPTRRHAHQIQEQR